MKGYCAKCAAETELKTITKQEQYSVKGEDITVNATINVCSECGAEIWDKENEDNTLREAYRQYREMKGLLQPDEIKAIRDFYELSQVSFARILGLGDKTIARYENGSLQDEAQNNLILLVRTPANFYKLLRKNKGRISDCEGKSIKGYASGSVIYAPFKARCQFDYNMPPLGDFVKNDDIGEEDAIV